MLAKQSSSVSSHLWNQSGSFCTNYKIDSNLCRPLFYFHQLDDQVWEGTCVGVGIATWRQKKTRSCSESSCSRHLLSGHRSYRLSSPWSLCFMRSTRFSLLSVFLPWRVIQEGEWWGCWASRSASCSNPWGRSRNPPPDDQTTGSPRSSRQSVFLPGKPGENLRI